MKIKESKFEEALAELKLHQLKKKFKLHQRREEVRREELIGVRSIIEQDRLRVRILEEEDLSEERSVHRYDSPLGVKKSKLRGSSKCPCQFLSQLAHPCYQETTPTCHARIRVSDLRSTRYTRVLSLILSLEPIRNVTFAPL